jgi:hypothetical protein
MAGDHMAPMIRRTGPPARMDSQENAIGATVARIGEMGVRCGVGVPIVLGAGLGRG